MPTRDKYEDHTWVLEQLQKAQKAEHDMREQAREAHLFVDKRDGMWEPNWWNASSGKPRYSFDMTNPIIDQITGDMEDRDFDIKISPSSGTATKEIADTYDGLVRNIENISSAKEIYSQCDKEMVTAGISGWRITHKYVDSDSFDQDLIIEEVGGVVDRVWLGPHQKQDGSDARYGWVLTGLEEEEFKATYPERSTSDGLSSDETENNYYYRHDQTLVGEFLYLSEQDRELVYMSNGKVYEDNEEYRAVVDELQQLGVVEMKRRKRKSARVYTRLFDLKGWITKPRESVFKDWIPLVLEYGNFKYTQNKLTYRGVVEKLYDPQRVLNYSLSREIEEGALAPRAKYWMTLEQQEGHEEELAELNTSADPVATYNNDPEVPGPPQQSGGAQINPGLRTISEAMTTTIANTAGMFAANMGDNPNFAQSGKAILALQSKGDQGNNKYITSREIAQRHTARILVKAIPEVYGKDRQVRLLNQDGSYEMVTIGQEVQDQQTGQTIVLHDLSEGTYDVICQSGPSFSNRQSETVAALVEISSTNPEIMGMTTDIILNNIDAPGMSDAAERARARLIQAGVIPQEQMTQEELQVLQQQQQQPPPEDPMMVAARAEEAKAQADMIDAQNKQVQIQQEGAVKSEANKIAFFKAETERMKLSIESGLTQAQIQKIIAEAAKAISEGEAQHIENAAVEADIMKIAEQIRG